MADFNTKRTWGPVPRYEKVKSYHRSSENYFHQYVLAGPCSVESKEQINLVGDFVAAHGATHLRGGIFRAGTYPGTNFGLIEEELIAEFQRVAKRNGLLNIIEVLDYSPESMALIEKYADCYQIGCRGAQHYSLLRKVGASGKPVFLKRHPGITLDEFLGAAEHVLTAGCKDLVLIERGSVSHLNHVRWDLSISMIPAIKAITQIPVVVDASHGTGRRDLVEPMTLAGIAAGADGMLLETHPFPEQSLSDSDQAIEFSTFTKIVSKADKIKIIIQ